MKREDGRKFFYQWERDQRLEVPAGCTQVHFANGSSDKAQYENVFEKDGKYLVNVPDNMLKVAAQLRCYAWDGASVIEYTAFDVVPREKPDLYVEPEEVRRFDKLEAELAMRSQGRNASYDILKPGWKRVLNIIRATSGRVDIGSASGVPHRMVQCLSFDFTGYVRYPVDTTDSKPVLIKRFENTFGEDAAVNDHPFKITKVRIGYPAEDAEFPGRAPDETDYTVNPVNCYMDIYVDFDPVNYKYGYVAFNMNYAGFAESNNCEAITEETDAVDIGIYGEELTYYEVNVDSMPQYLNSDMSLPYLSSGCVNSAYGVHMHSSGCSAINSASTGMIKSASNDYRVITPKNVGYAVEVHAPAAVIDDTAVSDKAWGSKNTVDKLCPAFTESGNVAVCEPVEGYPLDVVSTISDKYEGTYLKQITLTQCGKNLFDFQSGVSIITYITDSGGGSRYGYDIRLPAGTYTLKAYGTSTTSFIYGCVTDANNTWKASCSLVANSSYTPRTVTIEEGDIIKIYNGEVMSSTNVENSNKVFARFNIQIEEGSVETDYEPYRGQTFTANFINAPEIEGRGYYNWNTGLFYSGASLYLHDPTTGSLTMLGSDPENTIIRNIPATSGTNYFYSDCGNTTVSGRADPRPLFEKLTNAIVAMGGTV